MGMARLGFYWGMLVKSEYLQAGLQELGAIPQDQSCLMGSIEWNPCSHLPDFCLSATSLWSSQAEGWGNAKIPWEA